MGTPIITERGPAVRVIASASTWIEGEALRQLDRVAKFPGMRLSVGMPDLHPGKGSPVGAAFLSEGAIYPSLVGSDIGCGMSLWATDLPAHKARPERLAERLDGIDRPYYHDRCWVRRTPKSVRIRDIDYDLGPIQCGKRKNT